MDYEDPFWQKWITFFTYSADATQRRGQVTPVTTTTGLAQF